MRVDGGATTMMWDGRDREGASRWVRIIGLTVVGVQAVLLIGYSAHIYSHFDLTTDFAIYNQAWSLIAHGHLDPYSTLNPYHYPHYGYPYWSDHFELIMWPMALLWFLYPHSIDLLVVQDLATSGSTLVAFWFVLDLLAAHARRSSPSWDAASGPASVADVTALGALAVLVVNPWIYWAASFDFHIEALATFFLLLAARDLWTGRGRRSLLWIVGVLLCGNVAATYLVGLGISLAIARRDLRWTGAGLVALGAAWSLGVSAIGGGVGTIIGGNYGYLAGPDAGANPSIVAIATGALLHPTRPWRMFQARWLWTYRMLVSSGLVGVVSGIGFGVAAVVLGANTLNTAAVFSGPISSFQALPVYFFVVIGSVSVLLWMSRSARRALRWAVLPIAVAVLVQAAVLSVTWIPKARTQFLVINGPTADRLAAIQSRMPGDDEVVASQGVVGRFADRQLIFPFLDIGDAGQVIPVYGSRVVFVLTTAGIEYASTAGTLASVRYLEGLHARSLGGGDGVYAFAWHPPRGTRYITFPPTAPG
ncbi:MAG: DUF2079 domain-containing protein [Acidimicrobiales bacterium]|jgi:hypothetical protein